MQGMELIDEARLYFQIGERLKAKRSEMKISQSELAKVVGVLRTSISNIETGRQKAPLHLLYNICAALNVEPSAILPSLGEIQSSTVQIRTNAGMQEVPPKAASVVQQLLDE